jgi:hypothetical protein
MYKSKRAERRHHYQRLKKKRKKELKMRGDDPSERRLGYAVSVHNAGCSCSMCGNPRKFYNEKTIQERKQDNRNE